MKLISIPFTMLFVFASILCINGQGKKNTKSVNAETSALKYIRFEKGEHPTSFLERNPLIVTRLKQILGKIYPEFYRGLSVSSGFEHAGQFYLVSGISPHSQGLDSFLGFSENYATNDSKSQIYVIAKGFESGNYTRFYSTNSNKKVPIEMAIDAQVDTQEYTENIFLPPYMNNPFIVTDEGKLPVPRFLGNSIWRTFSILTERQSGIYKDEFETTLQFNERKRKELLKPIMGAITLSNKLAFRSEVWSSYDADNLELEITFPKVPCSIKSDISLNLSDYSCMEVSSNLEISSYIANTEYGRKIEVSKSEWEVYGLLIYGANKWKTEKESSPYRYAERYSIPLTMSIEKAKSVKENLEILFVGSIIEPYTVEGFSRIAPTVDRPYEEINNNHFLVFNLETILLFDKSNGEIVKRITFKQ